MRFDRDQRVVIASEALVAVDRGKSARVLITTDGLPTAHAVSNLIAHYRVFDHVPAIAASITKSDLDALRRHPGVLSVGLDEGGMGHLAEALPIAGFPPIASEGLTGEGITVAIIDSGIDGAHPDLVGAVIDEACFCSSGCCPDGETEAFGPGSAADDSGHGTHVAGIIASRGALTGQPGGAPAVRLVAIKILDAYNAFCCTSDLVAALDWLLTHHPGIDLVNMSFGANGLFASDCDAQPLVAPVASAVNALVESGSVMVASSGNNGQNGMPSPACLADVVSVGATWDGDLGPQDILCSEPTTYPDRIACFSNTSATLDLLAPGAIVISTWPGGMTRGRAGTSQAAPMVSACAATLLQAVPSAQLSEVAAALRTSPTWLMDERNGTMYPRLDCGTALQALRPPDAGMADDAGMDGATTWEDAALPGLDASFEASIPSADAMSDDSGDMDASPSDSAVEPENDATTDAERDAMPSDDGSVPVPPLPSDAMAQPDAPSHSVDPDANGGESTTPHPVTSDCACQSPGTKSERTELGTPALLALVAAALARRARRRPARSALQ